MQKLSKDNLKDKMNVKTKNIIVLNPKKHKAKINRNNQTKQA